MRAWHFSLSDRHFQSHPGRIWELTSSCFQCYSQLIHTLFAWGNREHGLKDNQMLTILLIVGLGWLIAASVFVLALAAAARDRVSPEVAASTVGTPARKKESIHSAAPVAEPPLRPVPSPIPA